MNQTSNDIDEFLNLLRALVREPSVVGVGGCFLSRFTSRARRLSNQRYFLQRIACGSGE